MFYTINNALNGKTLKSADKYLTQSGFIKNCTFVSGDNSGFIQYHRKDGRCITIDFNPAKRVVNVISERLG